MSQLEELTRRFSGLDIEFRRDWEHYRSWAAPWRVRLIANKNERSDYRLIAFGASLELAALAMVRAVERVERAQ